MAAVGSRRPEVAAAFAEKHEIPQSHGSYEELVGNPAVDIVYVATPHVLHLPNALLALSAGKHVLVEKPFTMDADEAGRLAAASRSAGLVAMEAMWTRWLPHMNRIRELVAAGALGELRTVVAHHGRRVVAPPTDRMYDARLGGGALLDSGIYPVSFAWDLLGAPIGVEAVAHLTSTGVDRQTSMLLTYETGATAALTCELDAANLNNAVVVGTEARIELDAPFFAPTGFRLVDAGGTVIEEYRSVIEGRGMQFQARAIESVIANGQAGDPVLPLDESVAIMGTVDLIRERIGLTYPAR
ncbi:putative dehydrogenase [Leifsonia shinshuensis]|nr:putative dehydrogenase [Leifsonia shinshuensis]